MTPFGITNRQLSIVIASLNKNERITRAWIFGSRATGHYKDNSDIDIAISGTALTDRDISELKEALELSSIPYQVDILVKEHITSKRLIAQIEQEGIEVLSN